MTQTVPDFSPVRFPAPAPVVVDVRAPRNARCDGSGEWPTVDLDGERGMTPCTGCCACKPAAFRPAPLAPAANLALGKAMAATATADQPF